MTHREILDMWPSLETLVIDTGDKIGNVKMWKYRDSIPSNQWVNLVTAASTRDIALTYKMLAEAASK